MWPFDASRKGVKNSQEYGYILHISLQHIYVRNWYFKYMQSHHLHYARCFLWQLHAETFEIVQFPAQHSAVADATSCLSFWFSEQIHSELTMQQAGLYCPGDKIFKLCLCHGSPQCWLNATVFKLCNLARNHSDIDEKSATCFHILLSKQDGKSHLASWELIRLISDIIAEYILWSTQPLSFFCESSNSQCKPLSTMRIRSWLPACKSIPIAMMQAGRGKERGVSVLRHPVGFPSGRPRTAFCQEAEAFFGSYFGNSFARSLKIQPVRKTRDQIHFPAGHI